MSAYICNPEQIALLAVYCAGPEQPGLGGDCVPYALKKEGVVDAESLARMLTNQNVLAVMNRYGDEPAQDLPGPGLTLKQLDAAVSKFVRKYLKRFPAITGAQLAGAISCYEYQTCELVDYESSPAYAACNSMVRELLRAMSGENAGWSFSDR